jgi:hypothetical protein
VYCQCSTSSDFSVGSCTLIVSILFWLSGLPSDIVNELNGRGKSLLAMYIQVHYLPGRILFCCGNQENMWRFEGKGAKWWVLRIWTYPLAHQKLTILCRIFSFRQLSVSLTNVLNRFSINGKSGIKYVLIKPQCRMVTDYSFFLGGWENHIVAPTFGKG